MDEVLCFSLGGVGLWKQQHLIPMGHLSFYDRIGKFLSHGGIVFLFCVLTFCLVPFAFKHRALNLLAFTMLFYLFFSCTLWCWCLDSSPSFPLANNDGVLLSSKFVHQLSPFFLPTFSIVITVIVYYFCLFLFVPLTCSSAFFSLANNDEMLLHHFSINHFHASRLCP